MADIQHTTITYTANHQEMEGVLVFDAALSGTRPGLVMAPNWMGVTENAVRLAGQVAAQGYAVFIADLYGKGNRPTSPEEAGAAMGAVKDTADEVVRMAAALATLKDQTFVAVDSNRVAAFGFCFGGHCALELARSGEALRAAISFHGTLDASGLHDAKNVQCPLLVLDGASDPLVPREQLTAFAQEMNGVGADWQLISYGGAVHSFTDPNANVEGVAKFHPTVSTRAFNAMYALLDEVI